MIKILDISWIFKLVREEMQLNYKDLFIWHKQGAVAPKRRNYKDLYGINKELSLLNERGHPPFLFPDLSSYNTNNQ